MTDYDLTNCLHAMVRLREEKSRCKGEELAAGTVSKNVIILKLLLVN